MTSMSKALALVIAIALGSSTEARAQIVITFAPPAAYIATSQPEYFEGRPVYWYNNNWYYRYHGRWNYYRREPVYLRDRRAHWAKERREDPRWKRGEERRGREDRREDQRDGRYHYRR